MTQQQGNNIGNVALPLLAAIGTGAATYYTLRNSQNANQQSMQQIGQSMQQFSGAANQQKNQQNQYS
ncbi:hypothetical protein [Scopulibacillus cellulosilyticus]|uniref:Uncharacterized protein n=1 Tax=Scopulibacillus cellulosilyticus TaxID=2665665 RepID=A0ABW2Q0M4_9BACL